MWETERMKCQFTPAAHALDHAAACLGRNYCRECRGPVGLLTQPERRAATMVARCRLTPRLSRPLAKSVAIRCGTYGGK